MTAIASMAAIAAMTTIAAMTANALRAAIAAMHYAKVVKTGFEVVNFDK